jgi:Transposase DDE domain
MPRTGDSRTRSFWPSLRLPSRPRMPSTAAIALISSGVAPRSRSIALSVSQTRPAEDWVGSGGRPRTLRNAFVTAERYQVGTVVCVHAKDMKEPWCLAASTSSDTAKQLMRTYGKRWGIEAAFRDTKDLRFGMGMASIRVSTPERRDRLWLLNAFAVVLLTLLGAAGEALGHDRHLKSNTSKKRTHSLFRQGAMLYELIPMMPEPRLRPLVERFGATLLEIPVFNAVYGIV